tara:strand:- start:2866 stop:3312 length:447 start_codon:yes stop_codon:yes gene_type:complete
MALEKYLALAGLALSVFFVAEIITIFNFMSNPLIDETFLFEAKPKIFQFISMSVAPAMIVFGVSFVLSKRYGSKLNGSLIAAGGVIILVGMIYAYTMIENIEEKLIDDSVEITPIIFMIVSIPIIILGLRLFKTRPRKPKKNYLEDNF